MLLTLSMGCGGAAAPPAKSPGNGTDAPASAKPALAEASVSGTSRTYCIWLDTASPRAVSTAVALGYPEPYAMTNTRDRELTTAPKNGAALRVEFVNLIGKTRINVSAVPAAAKVDAMAAEFFAAYEQGMRPSELCK